MSFHDGAPAVDGYLQLFLRLGGKLGRRRAGRAGLRLRRRRRRRRLRRRRRRRRLGGRGGTGLCKRLAEEQPLLGHVGQADAVLVLLPAVVRLPEPVEVL
eukprot:gene9020-biopygen1651